MHLFIQQYQHNPFISFAKNSSIQILEIGQQYFQVLCFTVNEEFVAAGEMLTSEQTLPVRYSDT